MGKNVLQGFKKWYHSLGVKSGLGLLALALGLIGVGITQDQLQYLYSAVPAAVTSGLILYRRFTQYTKGLGVTGTLALIVGVLAGGLQALPPDMVDQAQQFHDLVVGIGQILLTILGAYGIQRADKRITTK